MPTIDKRITSPSDNGTLDSVLKGKSIVQQRLAGEANPDFFTRNLTDEDYSRIGQSGTKDIAKRTIGGTAKDVLVSAAKGVVGLGESVVGLADIPTGGRVGKAMEDYLGYDAGATQKVLGEFYSDTQKAAFSEVEKAEGFFDTAKTMLEHPSTIAHALVESGPQMLGSAAMARKLMATGLLKSSPAWRGILAAATGEGAISAGATAEGIRTQTEDGLLTAKQSAMSVGSGIGTGIFGVVGGRVAKKLGIGDIDVFLGGGSAVTAKGVIKRIIGGGISEGAFEELPQSMQEQVWLNAAMGKPLLDGVAEAGAAGFVTGVAMGGGFGALQGKTEERKDDTAKDVLLDETPEEKDVKAKDILTKEPVTAESLAAEEAAAAFTEEDLEAATPEKKEPTATSAWAETLDDDAVSSRVGNLEKTEKEIGLSKKQKNNLDILRQEQIDRGIVSAPEKEVPRDRKEEERMARAERERKEPRRAVPVKEPSKEKIEPSRILQKEKADEAIRLEKEDKRRVVKKKGEEVGTLFKEAQEKLAKKKAEAEAEGIKKPMFPEITTDMDAEAQEAATSKISDEAQPTEAQIEAGTYKKGHIKVQGFDISVKNPDQSQRTGTDPDGKKWSVTMQGHYGYFKRSEGKDGEQIDVFVKEGEHKDTGDAYIVDQIDPKTGKFDEHKVMVGYESLEAAQKGYMANYEKGWKGLGTITPISQEGLKEFIGTKQAEPYADIKKTDDLIAAVEKVPEVPVKKKVPVEYVGMQERVGKPSFPIVTELDEGKSTVTFDPEKHEIVDKKEAYDKALKKAEPKKAKVEDLGRREEVRPEEPRRKEVKKRKRISEMTPEEMREELLINPVTIMPNKRAMKEREDDYLAKGEVSSKSFLDVDSLKYVNDLGGHAAGDELLNAVARALEEVTPEGFHISGDEFIILGKTDKEVDALSKQLNEKLAGVEIEFKNAAGEIFVYKGMGVSYGVHKDEGKADELLRKHKEEREAEGLRAERGERPSGIREKDTRRPSEREGKVPKEVTSYKDLSAPPPKPEPKKAEGIGKNFAGETIFEDKGGRFTRPSPGIKSYASRPISPTGAKQQTYSAQQLYDFGKKSYLTTEELSKFDAVVKPAKKVEPGLEGVDLSKITIKTTAIRESTGEKVTITESADKALAEVDTELENYYELLACL